MRIEIKDYRNIESMVLDLDDGKVNFIYGVSGSGKSTIIKAVSSEPSDNDVPVGQVTTRPTVLIDGCKPTYAGTWVYDENSVKQLILEPIVNELAYSAMIGDETALSQLESEFRQAINSLRLHLSDMLARRDLIGKLLSAFGERQSGAAFDKSAGISKLKKALSKTKTGTARIALFSSDKYISFIKDGTTVCSDPANHVCDYANHVCPFCKRKLSDYRYGKIEELGAITKSAYKIVFDNRGLIESLGIPIPDWTKKRSVSAFEKEIDKQIRMRLSLDELIEFCTASDGDIRQYELPKRINVCMELIDAMPALAAPIESVNNSITACRSLIGKMKKEFDKLVNSKKIKELNQSIKDIGIPYQFVPSGLDRPNKKSSYIIRHIKNGATETMSTLLSTGEKTYWACCSLCKATIMTYCYLTTPYPLMMNTGEANCIRKLLSLKEELFLSALTINRL